MSRNTIKAAAAPAPLALAPALPVLQSDVRAQVFEPTTGTHVWNDNNNWGPGPPQPFPNASGATATLPKPGRQLEPSLS